MKKVLFAVVVTTIFFISGCGKTAPQKEQTDSVLGEESLVQEKDSPLLFMDVTAKLAQDINAEGRSKYSITGTINNTAMQTKFKDVTLLIKYYSRTNDFIEANEIIVYKFFEPNTRTKFEQPINPPDSMQTIEVEVKDAKTGGQGS